MPIAVLLLVLLLGACAPEAVPPTPAPPTPASPSTPAPGGSPRPGRDLHALQVRLRPVAGGFSSPVLVTHAGDGSGDLYVVEQTGTVRVLRAGRVLAEPFLDVSGAITAGGEQGLLGLAFHPGYARNGRYFINYTDVRGDTVVAERVRDGDRERVLLAIDQPYANHNGGHLAFGPDGYLYVGTGDGGSGGDPHDNGQRLDTLLGKLLRIDVDGGSPYAVPAGNPFADGGGRPEIWAYGLRNPWRFSFDGGDLWVADVGQNAREEINRVPADRAGLNYGWNRLEGSECFVSGCDPAGTVLPVAEYGHDRGCSVTGGAVYRGGAYPALQGVYLVADYCSGTLWGLDAAAPRPEMVVLAETGRRVSSFGVGPAGEVYLVDHGGTVLEVTARRAG